VPAVYADKCQVNDEVVASCEYGDVKADRTVALVGDSMATQWQPALDLIGRKYGFRVVTYLKSSCAFTSAAVLNRGEVFPGCSEWNARALSEVLDIQPDVVVTTQWSATALADPQDRASASPEAMIAGLTDTWAKLMDGGSKVVAIAKNPEPPQEMYECAAQHAYDLGACTFDVNEATADVQRAAAARTPGVSVISMTDRICPGDKCPAVIGDALLYRQGSHLTKTWVLTATPVLEQRLLDVVPELARP